MLGEVRKGEWGEKRGDNGRCRVFVEYMEEGWGNGY